MIAEQYIEGIEYGAQTITTNGRINYCFLHTDWTWRSIPVGHCMPLGKDKNFEKKLHQATQQALKALNFTGPANVDLIVDKNENVYLLEIGARIGATCLPDLIHLSTNIDLYEQQVKLCLGKIQIADNCTYKIKNQKF